MEEQLPEPCYRCYFCHIISALHILAHMLEGDRGVSKLVSISKIKLKKKKSVSPLLLHAPFSPS